MSLFCGSHFNFTNSEVFRSNVSDDPLIEAIEIETIEELPDVEEQGRIITGITNCYGKKVQCLVEGDFVKRNFSNNSNDRIVSSGQDSIPEKIEAIFLAKVRGSGKVLGFSVLTSDKRYSRQSIHENLYAEYCSNGSYLVLHAFSLLSHNEGAQNVEEALMFHTMKKTKELGKRYLFVRRKKPGNEASRRSLDVILRNHFDRFSSFLTKVSTRSGGCQKGFFEDVHLERDSCTIPLLTILDLEKFQMPDAFIDCSTIEIEEEEEGEESSLVSSSNAEAGEEVEGRQGEGSSQEGARPLSTGGATSPQPSPGISTAAVSSSRNPIRASSSQRGSSRASRRNLGSRRSRPTEKAKGNWFTNVLETIFKWLKSKFCCCSS